MLVICLPGRGVVGIGSKSDHAPPFAHSVRTFAKANCPHRTLFCVSCLQPWLSTKSVWYSLLIFVTLLKISGQLTEIFQYAFVFSLFDQAGAIKLQRVFHSIHCDSGIFRQVTQKFLHKSQLLGIANNLVPTNSAAW